jgi:IS605 OrfB family transposase
MVNEAIRVGLKSNPRSRFELRNQVYFDFKKRYGLHSHYAYSACEVAYSIVKKNRKWGRPPCAKRLMLKLDNESYWLKHMLLRIPTIPHNYLFIVLAGGDYQLGYLTDETLKRGSVTITPDKIIIAFSKEVNVATEFSGRVAYDLNLRSVVGISTKSPKPIVYDTSKILRIRAQYRRVVSNLRHDNRILRKVAGKYGAKESRRVRQRLHLISKQIVTHAKENGLSITLENLKNIRKHHTKGNRESRRTREKLNKWAFRQLENMIDYKAAWELVPEGYVNPANSSKTCSICRHVNAQLKYERVWQCPNCGATHNRDVNSAVNLLMRSLKGDEALRFGVDRLAVEAMKWVDQKWPDHEVDASQTADNGCQNRSKV